MSEEKQKIFKPRPVSGYPEWLPEERLVELRWIDEIRSVFESYGFCSIETPSVEEVDVLVAKGGDADKEIYALKRLHEDPDARSDARVALHYDLTVPLARYVAQHYGDLVFPFKRYQIQKAWRGERPQEGRFREFLQCDIDVIDNDNLSIEFDAEMPAIAYEIFQRLNVGNVTININNRKILQGFYSGLGLSNVIEVIRIVDKMDKIGPDGVGKLLLDELRLDGEMVAKCLSLAKIRTNDSSFVSAVRALGIENETLDEGLTELEFVMNALSHIPPGVVFADLSIARGFDYYTGTVYETKLADYPDFPSICSGGRYDNLVSSYMNKRLPGVGFSIGLTRIFVKLLKEGKLDIGAKSPTAVMVAQLPESDRALAATTAQQLRARGINVEMYHEQGKLKNQLRYAERKGIAFVWFPPVDDNGMHEVKNMATGEQVTADIATWRP
ncbi:MAG: histidine--tRNA ligase [Rhodospirillaceae bacterium]|nr:histidine--tRNA ligase [Rhodospirillaceae bacterium]